MINKLNKQSIAIVSKNFYKFYFLINSYKNFHSGIVLYNNFKLVNVGVNNNINNNIVDYNEKLDIEWTKDYKNLNKLLSVKGLDSNTDVDVNIKKYLILSVSGAGILSPKKWNDKFDIDLIMSLKLLLLKSDKSEINNKLYDVIFNKLLKNKNLIKDGGYMSIYYISNKVNGNIKEGWQSIGYQGYRKGLVPSISKSITLNNFIVNEKLIVNIYVLSYNTFFNEFLKDSDLIHGELFNRNIENKNLWGYPYLIVEDLNLSTLVYLFKECGVNLHGMSHTLRHKLSPLEENLSNFLYVTDLNESVYNSYLSFNDKTFSNNKLDFDLYNQIYEIQKVNSEKKEFLEKAYIETSNITDIKKRKDLLKQELKLENLKTKYFNISLTSLSPISLILILRNHIIELEQKIYELNNSKNNYLLRLNEINLEIDELINKDIEVDIVINKLIDMKLNLESKVIEHQNKLNSIKQQIELDKIIHKENKIKRKVIKDKKNKKKKIDNKKAILKQLMPDLSKINSINKKFVSEENLLLSNKVKLNEITEDIKSNESSRIYNVSNLSNRDKDKKNLDLSLSNTENNIINLNNDLNLSSNTNFSKEILNNINNRGKKKNNKFINNNNIKVRKYSTKSYLEDSNFYLDSPIFFELKRIINNSPRTEETQIIIEKFLMDHANNLLIKKIDQDTEINYNRLNSKVLNFISKQVGEILLLIQNYKNNILYISENQQKELTTSQKVEYKIIVNLDNDKILSFILGRLLRIISYNSFSLKKNNQTQIAKDLGEALLWEYFYLEHKKYKINNKTLDNNIDSKALLSLSAFIAENPEHIELKNMATDYNLILIGLRLLNFLVQTKLIISTLEQIDKEHKIHVFVASSDIKAKYLNSLDALNLSSKIPMLVPPKKYFMSKNDNVETLGGFLLNDVKYVDPLIIKRQDLENSSSLTPDNKIYDLVNNLSSVGFKINIQVLNFILTEGIKYDLISDFNSPHPLEIVKLNKKEKTYLEDKKKLESFLSRRSLEKNILGLALIYENVNEFFIPVRLDNRGRAYCMVDYLNYQGIDLAKSLLLFSKEEKIYLNDKLAIDYLKIYGANCFGNGLDKKSYDARIQWINDNENDILNFEDGKLLKQAELKLLFLSFCFEYQKYYNNKKSEKSFYYSDFPIKLDSTCNGFQHIALILGDLKIAKNVNITLPKSFDETPMDFYFYIAAKVKERIELMVSNDKLDVNDNDTNSFYWGDTDIKKNKIKNSCVKLLKLKVSRQLVKTTIMVKPYNASIESRTNYLKDKFEKKIQDGKEIFINEDNLIFNSYDLTVYSTIIDKVISNEFPKLTEFNKYLNNIANICSKLKIPIIWTVPSGLIVTQKYLKTEALELKPFKYSNKTFKLAKTNENKEINIFKQKRSLMPNLVHSLDATSLCLLVDSFCNYLKKNKFENANIFTIHDCFATNYNKMDDLINLLKAVYIKIYTEDSYLKKFDEGILNYIQFIYGKDCYNPVTKILKVSVDTETDVIKLKYPNVDAVISGEITSNDIHTAFGGIN